MENTFRVTIQFYPGRQIQKEKPQPKQRNITNSAFSTKLPQKEPPKKKKIEPIDVISEKNKSASMQYTNLQYILKGTLLNQGDPIIDITPFVQGVTVPNLSVINRKEIGTFFGSFIVPGNLIQPDQRTVSLEVVNTKLPILETVFYPWMNEVTKDFWFYDTQPFTTARIDITLQEHADIVYTFYGCYPEKIMTYDPNMALNSQFSRNVEFTFQYMYIKSNLKSRDNIGKLGEIGSRSTSKSGKFSEFGKGLIDAIGGGTGII